MPCQVLPPSWVRTIEVHGAEVHGALPSTQLSVGLTNVAEYGTNPAGTGPPFGCTDDVCGCPAEWAVPAIVDTAAVGRGLTGWVGGGVAGDSRCREALITTAPPPAMSATTAAATSTAPRVPRRNRPTFALESPGAPLG